MFVIPADELEILEIINQLDNKSSSGVDHLSNTLVKVIASTITHLTKLINMSFRQGVIPSELKTAKVIPTYKSGSKLDENNDRPISLRMVFSKIFGGVMCNH